MGNRLNPGCACCDTDDCLVELLINEAEGGTTEALSGTQTVTITNDATLEESSSYVIDTTISHADGTGLDFSGLSISDGKTTVTFETTAGDTVATVKVDHNNWPQSSIETPIDELLVRQFREVTFISDEDASVSASTATLMQVRLAIIVYNRPTGSEIYNEVISVYATNTYDPATNPLPLSLAAASVTTPDNETNWVVVSALRRSGLDRDGCPLIQDNHICPITHRRWRRYTATGTRTSSASMTEETVVTVSGEEERFNTTCCDVDRVTTTTTAWTDMDSEDGTELLTLSRAGNPVTDSDEINEFINGPMDEHWYWDKWNEATWNVIAEQVLVSERLTQNLVDNSTVISGPGDCSTSSTPIDTTTSNEYITSYGILSSPFLTSLTLTSTNSTSSVTPKTIYDDSGDVDAIYGEPVPVLDYACLFCAAELTNLTQGFTATASTNSDSTTSSGGAPNDCGTLTTQNDYTLTSFTTTGEVSMDEEQDVAPTL